MLVLGAFSTGVFQTPMHYPALTLTSKCEANQRESVLFIGTQISNLYTAVDTPAEPCGCVFVLVNM
jgi:hypothetical protein